MTTGLSYDALFPGRFIKAGEMAGKDVTLTIRDVEVEELEKEDGSAKLTAIVKFAEIKREWVLNKTCGQCLRAMWGDSVDDWIGKRVTLFPEPDASGLSDSGVCIRVKGSPDIAKTVKAQIKLPRRRPMERTLVPTGKGHGFEGLADDPVEHSLSGTTVYDPHDAEPEEPVSVDAADEEFLAETADDGKASRAQLNKVRALIKKSELSEDQWRAYMEEITGSNIVSDLTPQGAELFTEFLSGTDSRLAV